MLLSGGWIFIFAADALLTPMPAKVEVPYTSYADCIKYWRGFATELVKLEREFGNTEQRGWHEGRLVAYGDKVDRARMDSIREDLRNNEEGCYLDFPQQGKR